MAQKIINVGSVANDGTGDTIRGAFTNVNANFTEVYASVIETGIAFAVANAAFDEANVIYTSVGSLAVGANAWANAVGTAGNAYASSIGSSSNAFTTSVGASANSFTLSMGDAINSYSSILSANNAVGANAWANAVGVASNNWSITTFATLSNTAIVYNTANASFAKANAALANTTSTLQGNLTVTGPITTAFGFFDGIGPVREKVFALANSDAIIQTSQAVIVANNSNTINIKIPDDNVFLVSANLGTRIDVYQYGTGDTKIMANDAAVTIRSSNNWSNIAGQYLSASIVKIQSNTWMLVGNLKA